MVRKPRSIRRLKSYVHTWIVIDPIWYAPYARTMHGWSTLGFFWFSWSLLATYDVRLRSTLLDIGVDTAPQDHTNWLSVGAMDWTNNTLIPNDDAAGGLVYCGVLVSPRIMLQPLVRQSSPDGNVGDGRCSGGPFDRR